MTVLLQVLTLGLLMLCGLIAVRFRVLDQKGVGALNTFVLNFAQVGLIISKLQQDSNPELVTELAWMFALTCLSMVSNCGYMGYPVIIATMGEDALIYAVVFVAAFNLMCWTMCAYYFGGKEAMQPKRLLSNPSLIAVIIGLTLFLTGWRLPGFINSALSMVGETTTPLAMFVIGARLISLRPHHLKDTKLLLVCLLRLLVFPLAILLLRLTPLSRTVVDALYLCTAMPCAALTAMQADLFDCDTELASRGVAVSTALSLITVPLMLMLI